MLDNLADKNPPSTKSPIVGYTPLHIAAQAGQVDACRLILKGVKNKNPPDMNGETPLHLAASYGHLEACKVLLEELDDKNPMDLYGRTPAICAVQNHHYMLSLYIVKYLIKNWIVKCIGQ
jgi:ankyrin repeat protein